MFNDIKLNKILIKVIYNLNQMDHHNSKFNIHISIHIITLLHYRYMDLGISCNKYDYNLNKIQ